MNFKFRFASVGILAFVLTYFAVVSAEDYLIERPEAPTEIQDAPPILCWYPDKGWTKVNGCNPVNDPFCSDPCNPEPKILVNRRLVFHPDGDYWFRHYCAAYITVKPLWEKEYFQSFPYEKPLECNY